MSPCHTYCTQTPLTSSPSHSPEQAVGSAVVVLKSLIQSSATSIDSTSSSAKLVSRLVKSLDPITNPSARACVFWLAGQYASQEGSNGEVYGVTEFEGLAKWAPDTLRKAAKGFMQEVSR